MTQKSYKIFITNDDGISAKGLQSVLRVAERLGEVLCIAPTNGQSGMSHAITFADPIRLTNVSTHERVQKYHLTGTPVDCVKMALDKFYSEQHPDLIISGVNHGSNASICSIYSGTVAAAREGAINSIPSVAFSNLDFGKDADFECYEEYMFEICKFILTHGLEPKTFLNVNFPCHDVENIKGIKVCKQTNGVWVEEFDKRTDPHNQSYYWLTGHFDNFEPNAQDSDEWLLKQNYITVVPLKLETTSLEALEKLTNLNTK